jgi:nitrogen fixation/metabolism regulation signal transduction histidine kinase
VLQPGTLVPPGGLGLWTTLEIDGARHRTYLFSAPDALYGLAYPELTAGRFVADNVEAVAAMTLMALGVVLLVVAGRSLLRLRDLSAASLLATISSRFTLRLLVAFLAVAALPVAVLELVVRGSVAERLRTAFEEQAVERASFAKKLVEDYVYYQRGEGGAKPIGDEQLVWVASVIRNDLEVFVKDRLLAASKRELYDSGLIAPRVSGAVYRALVLESKPFALQGERIGEFSYLVVSVPVRLGGSELGILSIPLTLRQREVETAVADLDRTMRLGSVMFLGLAAILAHSMARRISGPISALTEGTRRIAQGDLTIRVTATSRDELMRLVESFNQMAGDLDRQRRDLERTNRLAAWGEMARQIAHEVKNPLTPIQLSAEHLRRAYDDKDPGFERTLQDCTETILKQVRTLRGIVTEFSAFARPPATVLQPLQPTALVAGVLKPYEAVLPPGVELSLHAVENVPSIKADRRLLERALVNLIENALQAVGDSGRINVEIRPADGGGRVEVEVRDSGPGLNEEVRDRVFEPFFSTKTSGSGLGLALVKKIAEDHGGGVTLESPQGKGTRALLWLPASVD